MCGIVGFVGREEAAPILLDGLARLEYRGYDYLKEWLSDNLFFKNGALAFPSVQCKKSKRTMPFYKYNIKWPDQLYLCWYSTSKCDII